MPRSWIVVLLGWMLGPLGSPYVYAVPVARPILMKGSPAVDVGIGVDFNFFSDVSLNNRGDLAFVGSVSGPGVLRNAIWTVPQGDATRLTLLAQEGDAISGGGETATIRRFDELLLNSRGNVAYVSDLSDGSTAIHRRISGQSSTIVARTGSEAPGSGGASFGFFGNVLPFLEFNSRNEVAYLAGLFGDNLNSGGFADSSVWRDQTLIARFEEPSDDQVTIGTLDDPALDDRGVVAFRSRLNGIGRPGDIAVMIASSSSTIQTVVVADSFPEPEDSFSSLGDPVLNNAGQIALVAKSADTNTFGLWLGGTSLSPVASTGSISDFGTTFSGFSSPLLNDVGKLAFQGSVIPEGDPNTLINGIWGEGIGEGLRQIALEGMSAPGTDELFGSALGRKLAFNNRSQVAFSAIDSSNRLGIWAEDTQGNLHLIARVGSPLDIDQQSSTNDLRTVTYLEFVGERGFNDRGQVAFSVRFEDGSGGLFVSDLVAVTTSISTGDFNNDGAVNELDYLEWKNSFGLSVGLGEGADGNNNGIIDAADYTIWRDSLGSKSTAGYLASRPSPEAVPEPLSILLALSACGLLYGWSHARPAHTN